MTHVSGRSCNLLTSRKMLQRIRNVLQATWRYLTKMLQNSKNIIQGTWRRCENVMHGTWWKGRAEDVTMHQERVASHSKRMLQRIRNIWQVTADEAAGVSGRSCNLLTSRKMLQRIRNVLQATWRRCCNNIARTSFKGLEEDVTRVPKCPQVSPKPTPSVPKC